MKISLTSLRKLKPCESGYKWCHKNFKKGQNDLAEVLRNLNNDNHYDWANWLIVRHMTYEQQIKYAIFVAEQVIDIFEKKYPKDDRPRKAIEAAKEYLKTKAAYAAAYAAYAADAADAAYAADAAADAAYAAADAAYAADAAAYAADAADAARAAYAAAYAARAADAAYAADAAADAAYAAAYAADAAAELKEKIIEYGISLIEEAQ